MLPLECQIKLHFSVVFVKFIRMNFAGSKKKTYLEKKYLCLLELLMKLTSLVHSAISN